MKEKNEKPPKKVNKPTTDTSKDSDNIVLDEELKEAISTKLRQFYNKKTIHQENVQDLASVIDEFLQNYLLIGYNYDGDVISYTSASTQLQADSLNTAIVKFITTSQKNISDGPPSQNPFIPPPPSPGF